MKNIKIYFLILFVIFPFFFFEVFSQSPSFTFSYRLPYNPNGPYTDYSNDFEDIDYWYHSNSNGSRVEPKNHSPIPAVFPKTNSQANLEFIKNQCCPSSFESGGGSIEDLIGEKNEASEKIDSIEGLLAMLIDGGNTPGTAIYVQTSNSSQTLEVHDDLLSKSPYLSDSVMISAAAKEDVLPPAVITEILSANPQAAKSDTVMEILENRTTPLTEDQLANIEEGLFITGAKESLEAKLAGYTSDYNTALNKIIQHYKNDSLNPAAADSVILFLNSENQLWAKYTLAFEYFANGDSLSAGNTLNNIPATFSLNSSELNEHQQYLILFGLLKQLKQQGKSISEVDSIQIQTLAAIMNNSDRVVSGYARNILAARGEIVYKESVLNTAMLTDILSENPQSAKSDTVLFELENRVDPLTDDQMTDVMQGLYITGPKEALESNLAGYRLDYSRTLNNIIRYYSNDTLNVSPEDSILSYLAGSDYLWARYQQAFILNEKGDSAAAISLIGILSNSFPYSAEMTMERQNYLDLIHYYNQCRDSSSSILQTDSINKIIGSGF